MKPINFRMFKISGGVKSQEFFFTAISDQNAVTVAEDFHKKCGLIGRYYCETETGYDFQVNN